MLGSTRGDGYSTACDEQLHNSKTGMRKDATAAKGKDDRWLQNKTEGN
jgi:hypothetical protein